MQVLLALLTAGGLPAGGEGGTAGAKVDGKNIFIKFYIYTFRTRLLFSGSPLHHIAVAYCN